MFSFEKSLEVMSELFARDCTFSLATVRDNVPSLRVVDIFYDDGAFWIVTYGLSQKVKELEQNGHVALCHELYRFTGYAVKRGAPAQGGKRGHSRKADSRFRTMVFRA